MKDLRRVVAGLAVIAAVLGLSVATAGTAVAAEGSWLNYGNTNPITSSASTWHCDSTVAISPHVGAQVCAIRSPNGRYVQAAVIVRNNRVTDFATSATMQLHSTTVHLNTWDCRRANIPSYSWVVCYGETIAKRASVKAVGNANYTNLGTSPWI